MLSSNIKIIESSQGTEPGATENYGQEKAEAESKQQMSSIAKAGGLHCFFLGRFLMAADHGC